ncbi:MAG: hypothetical protein A3I63_05555 [Betaproteobacteria bacterium RIFCSPLOWO2_02_FULL_66_14]|nr:MAG: hypothetical protein A3I63_05555 [Betaproteobacteria bacterium RIFCSPLOWO2_02_FULL_66_14]
MYKHILIPTDGSPISARAVRAGMRLAKALGARVTGFFASPPATPVVYRHFVPVGFTTPQAHAAVIDAAAKRYLGAIAGQAKKAGVRCTLERVTSDFPAESILETAAKRGCDLIVMASHGRRGVSGVLLGSETQKVLLHAKIAVMVVR